MMLQIQEPRGYHWRVGDVLYDISTGTGETVISVLDTSEITLTTDNDFYHLPYHDKSNNYLLLRRYDEHENSLL